MPKLDAAELLATAAAIAAGMPAYAEVIIFIDPVKALSLGTRK